MKKVYLFVLLMALSTQLTSGVPQINATVDLSAEELTQSLKKTKTVVSNLTQKLDKNAVNDSLSRAGSALKNAILYSPMLGAKEYQELIKFSLKNKKLLWEKIPAIFAEFLSESADAIVQIIQQDFGAESFYTDYEDLKNHITHYIEGIFTSPSSRSTPTSCHHTNDETKIFELLEACNYDCITPFLVLLVMRALPENNSELLKTASSSDSSFIEKVKSTIQNVIVKTIKKYLGSEEINNLIGFVKGSTYKTLVKNINYLWGIMCSNVNPKVKEIFSASLDDYHYVGYVGG